jgi:hypothetical protein
MSIKNCSHSFYDRQKQLQVAFAGMSGGGGGEGGDGGRKVDQPLSKIYTKNAIQPKRNTLSLNFSQLLHTLPLQKLAKTLLTLPFDFNPFASMGQKVFKYFIIEMLASANFHLNL